MTTHDDSIDRREAIRRVTALLGGVAFVGGQRLLDASELNAHALAARVAELGQGVGPFSRADVAFLDEVADTILPDTKTPGAKAAKVGAFMALMVTDIYDSGEQQIFRNGMTAIDDASKKANGVVFARATPRQRLALLQELDRQQKAHMDARDAARKSRDAAFLPDQRKEAAPAAGVNPAAAITADSPTHYFRMMKELALLGYFTSAIGCMQAQRYVESPGRFDPCVPYTPSSRAWAPHA